MKFLIWLYLIIFLASVSYATDEVTQIKFNGAQFVEIYSTNNLDFQDAIIFGDDETRYNTLNKVKEFEGSNKILIIGSRFSNENDISILNCTIYRSDRTQVLNGGFRNSGESFSIKKNDNIIFEFSFNGSVSLESNQAYYPINNSINLSRPCISQINESVVDVNQTSLNITIDLDDNLSIIQNTSVTNNSIEHIINQTIEIENIIDNDTQITNTTTDSCDNYNFNINLQSQNNIIEDRILFSFSSNINSNYTIEYWVENYLGEISKPKLNTTNKNQKSFTPRQQTEIYLIKANKHFQDCVLSSQEQVIFYSKQVNNHNSNNSNPSQTAQNECNILSYFEILNKDEIYLENNNTLKYKLYRDCETNKRTVYIRLNNREIDRVTLEKDSVMINNVSFVPREGLNIITIEGLDVLENFYFTRINSTPKTEIVYTQRDFIELMSPVILYNKVYFNIFSNFNYEGSCIIMEDRSYVSDNVDISNNVTNYKLEIDNNRLTNNSVELRVNCRYTKEGNISPTYIREFFNYTKIDPVSQNLSSNINNTLMLPTNMGFLSRNLISNYSVSNQLNYTDEYESKNILIKNSSALPFLAGLGLLSTLLAIRNREL